MVDFWEIYEDEARTGLVESKKLALRMGTRWNASLGQIADRSMELGFGEARVLTYDESHRYMIAKELTYDMLLSVYDVNTRSIFAARLTVPLGKTDLINIEARLRKLGVKNLEIRLIGLQNKSNTLIGSLSQFRKYLKGTLTEVDLYGTETRHIAIDTKTGTSYNLLLQNRIYKPGELANALTPEAFVDKKSKFHFVEQII